MIYAIGDSHAGVFKKIPPIKVCTVPGATNMGLKNPRSKTLARPQFDSFLENIKKEDNLIFLMGEVDCGFVIWYRVEKYNDTLESQMEESLSNYFSFIGSYINRCRKIIVCDAPPPTISDNKKQFSEVAKIRNQRLALKVSRKKRTDLTLRYNEKIKNFCSQNSLIHIEYAKECLGENGIVDPKWLNVDKTDHHLNDEKFVKLMKIKLKEVGVNE